MGRRQHTTHTPRERGSTPQTPLAPHPPLSSSLPFSSSFSSLFFLGKRRYDRKQSGYGGQTKPVFHKKAKNTKKIVLKLECTQSKAKSFRRIKRCKTIILGKKENTKGEVMF